MLVANHRANGNCKAKYSKLQLQTYTEVAQESECIDSRVGSRIFYIDLFSALYGITYSAHRSGSSDGMVIERAVTVTGVWAVDVALCM